MMVINFFFTTNAAFLYQLEVQFMKKWFPEDLAAPKHPKRGWSEFFTYNPLIETTENENSPRTENKREDDDAELLQYV